MEASILTTVEKVKAATAAAVAVLKDYEPTFPFRVGWASDYQDLFLERFSDAPTTPDALLTAATKYGRVILHGRGGGAKSVILQRLWRKTLKDPNLVAVYFDLKRWTPEHYRQWTQDLTVKARVDLLFQEFAIPRISAAELDELTPRAMRLLLVDGLNEVVSSTAQELVTVLDEYVRFAVATRVIVADRLSRREFARSGRWRLAMVLPLSESEIRAAFRIKLGSSDAFDNARPTSKALLTSPYYLNAALQEGRVFAIGSEVHHNYFAKYASLTPQEFIEAARAAFTAYSANRSRTFSLGQFEEDASPNVLQKLLAAGAIQTANGSGYFTHHLKHDYLAALHLAHDDELWNYKSFTAATLYASSFDILALTLELVSSPGLADRFVRRVYDWNLYGAAYALAEALHNGIRSVSRETEVMLLAMLAERRWDRIYTTAERSRDALSLFPPSSTARELLEEASDFEGVFEIVARVQTENEDFLAWRRLFTLPPGSDAPSAVIRLLEHKDSVLGWTAANVLKRTKLSPSAIIELCQRALAEVLPEIQWRMVHVLGAYPDDRVADTLLAILSGNYDLWVRYGSIRSLVEIAARGDATLRARVFAEVIKRASAIGSEERVLQEFKNAIKVRRDVAPNDWRERALDVVHALKGTAGFVERLEDLERLELDIAVTYSSSPRS